MSGGTGYLFKDAINLALAHVKHVHFTSGEYIVADTSCIQCSTKLGWKYLYAFRDYNARKVGMFCLCRADLLTYKEKKQESRN
jgi:hypothetical protein